MTKLRGGSSVQNCEGPLSTSDQSTQAQQRAGLKGLPLEVAALGVVFGDIGTSHEQEKGT